MRRALEPANYVVERDDGLFDGALQATLMSPARRATAAADRLGVTKREQRIA